MPAREGLVHELSLRADEWHSSIAAHSRKEIPGCRASEFWSYLRDEAELLGALRGAVY
jgi:hypothetical protein